MNSILLRKQQEFLEWVLMRCILSSTVIYKINRIISNKKYDRANRPFLNGIRELYVSEWVKEKN